jgi:hypothetical protein
MEQLDFFIKFVRNIHPKMKKIYLKRLFYSVTLLGIVVVLLYHFNFFSCNSRQNYIQKFLYQRQRYDLVVSDNEVVIINSYRVRNGATLFSIQKIDMQWKLVQELKLDKYIPVPISGAVVNNDWLAIDCDNRSNSVIIFRKNNNMWEYYNKIDGDTGWFGNTALKLDNDLLIIGDWASEEQGIVSVYDLKSQPPLLKQKIYPPKEITRNGKGFGNYLVLRDNWLMIHDFGVYFSEEDLIKYSIKPSDRSSIFRNGKRDPIKRPGILLYSKNSQSEWIFIQDIFFGLPHPPNGILRNKDGKIVNFHNTFSQNTISFANKKLFLYDYDKYYVFGLSDALNWKYEISSNPPFVPSWAEQRSPYRFRYHFESIVINSNYSAHFGDKGNIDIYRTTDYANWKSRWTIPFYNPPTEDILKLESVAYKLEINQNIIVAYYNWFLQEKKTTPTNTGKIAIFEIDSQKGPICVFQMEAFDNGALTPCDCSRNFKIP